MPTTYDPFAPEMIADPYPWYDRLLAEPGPLYVPHRDLWVLSRYDAVRQAARAHEALSSAEGVMYARMGLPMMLTLDPPDHDRLRRLVSYAFTRRTIETLRPQVEKVAAPLVVELTGGGDAVALLASALPVTVIAELLGIPGSDRDLFREWADQIVKGFNLLDRPREIGDSIRPIADAIGNLRTYFAEVTDRRSKAPGDDLISRLITDGDLSSEELFWFCFLLLIAGTETTTNLLGALLHLLATRPSLHDILAADPARVPDAVEETLRWASPIQGLFRSAATSYGDIPAGARVLLLFAAANRDPDHFSDPAVFDLDRRPTEHLAFGSGIHLCLGAHLARLETAVAINALLPYRLALAGEPIRTANPTLRGFASLPLAVRSR